MSKKKFSPRQQAQLNNRREDRAMRRITGERYVEDNRHIIERDMMAEMETWY